MLDYESQTEKPPRAPAGTLATFVAAGAGTFLWSLVYPLAVNSLPWSPQGVRAVPWRACVLGYFVFAVIVPYIGTLAVSPDWRFRVKLLVFLAGFSCTWYFGLGFDGVLSKAWRRGF